MRLKYLSSLLLILAFALSANAQKTGSEKAFFEGTISSVEYVSPISSRPDDLIPSDNSIKEAKDKRSLAYESALVPGKDPQKEDDYFVRNRHEMEQTKTMAPPSLVFDAYASGSQPTDPSLAVGPNHVIVVFNTGFAIYDKSGNQLLGQTSPNPAIFPNGGCCDLTVSYDNDADRWVLTFLGAGAQIAVSDGPDPLNAGWFIYTIGAINDYQKLSVWSDGYYITDNTGSSNKVWALERAAMLNGSPSAQILGFNLPGLQTSGFYSPQVLNVTDNNLPAAGGATVVYMQDDAWSGVNVDHVKVWTIDVDWSNTGNSTISAPTQINTTPFISVFDNGSFSNLSQPGGSNIDALQATIMNQAQFRKFGTHNSAVFNFVVDTDASNGERAGVRWFEFRQNGDNQPWSLYQEGTYTAANGKHAWNASLAMDANGNIGMGYTAMSGPATQGTVRVSSYYTGRLNGDPLGTMTVAEGLIANGNQNIPGFRYGDYSKIDVDPSTGSSFWFINEYMNSGRRGVVGVFQIQAGPPDNQAPTDPTNLVATAITGEGATLTWNPSTDNVAVTQYNIFIDGVQVGTSATPSYVVTGLSPLTTYNASVNAQDAAGNVSGNASTSFTTLAASYCSSMSQDISDEYIGRVQLNTIDNTSGAQFYSDFTAISTPLNEGQTYSVTVTPVWTATIYSEGYAVWIDYNGDADFTDPGELVFSQTPTQATPVSGNFTVPAGTVGGATRMRVSMKYNGVPSSCETFQYGEVEDYTIVLGTGGGDTTPPSTPTNLTASNTTNTTTDLTWNPSTDNIGVTGYEIFQDNVSIGTVAVPSATVTGLTANTTYVFKVRAFDAAGNNSPFSNNETVTTTGGGGGSPGQIAAYFFETGLDGWIDGGSDCRRITNPNVAFEGIGAVMLRDGSNTSNAVSPTLDLSSNSEVTVEFHFYSRGMEPGEDFVVEFFDGSSYQVVAQYVSGVDFPDNAFTSPPLIVLNSSTYNFNANNNFRIRCNGSANNDKIVFDQVIISGDNVILPLVQPSQMGPVVDNNNTDELISFAETTSENVKIYPNPTVSELTIEMQDNTYDEIMIFSSKGEIVYVGKPGADQLTIDVSQYAKGMYFIRFISDGIATTQRFIKK